MPCKCYNSPKTPTAYRYVNSRMKLLPRSNLPRERGVLSLDLTPPAPRTTPSSLRSFYVVPVRETANIIKRRFVAEPKVSHMPCKSDNSGKPTQELYLLAAKPNHVWPRLSQQHVPIEELCLIKPERYSYDLLHMDQNTIITHASNEPLEEKGRKRMTRRHLPVEAGAARMYRARM